jgi:hypothetical protein
VCHAKAKFLAVSTYSIAVNVCVLCASAIRAPKQCQSNPHTATLCAQCTNSDHCSNSRRSVANEPRAIQAMITYLKCAVAPRCAHKEARCRVERIETTVYCYIKGRVTCDSMHANTMSEHTVYTALAIKMAMRCDP